MPQATAMERKYGNIEVESCQALSRLHLEIIPRLFAQIIYCHSESRKYLSC